MPNTIFNPPFRKLTLKINLPYGADNSNDYKPGEREQANFAWVVRLLADYLSDQVELVDPENWPDNMLAEATKILALCDLAFTHWQNKRFDDCLVVADQAQQLLDRLIDTRGESVE
jgi:hypothetical protein